MQQLSSKILKLLILVLCMFIFYSEQTTFAESKEHIVHFPQNRSMGMLYVLDLGKADTDNYDDWQVLCKATGDVTIPNDKALRLDLAKESVNNLSPLSKLQPDDLTMLFCDGIEIPDAELRHISHLTGLQEVFLRDTNILGTGLKYLAKLKSLKRLRIDYTHVGDNELAHLSNLPSLERLNLGGTPTSDAGMVHVGKITCLTHLYLSRGIGDEGLGHLANLTEMESLSLYSSAVSDVGLVHLKRMKKLKRLDLEKTFVTENGLVHLSGLKNLERLSLPFAVGDAGLEYLSKMSLLKSIDINCDLVTSKGLAALSKKESLDQVRLSGINDKDEIVGKLAALYDLKTLTVHRGLTDKGLIRLRNMKSLQKLYIGISQVTSKGFAALAEFPSLKELSFFDIQIPSDECWKNLGKLTSLQRLDLLVIRSRITDKNIECLTGLLSLKELQIVPAKEKLSNISDTTLRHVAKLKSMERLTLKRMNLTDKGLMHLEKLSSLKEINFEDCRITEEGLQQLKKKMPALHWYL